MVGLDEKTSERSSGGGRNAEGLVARRAPVLELDLGGTEAKCRGQKDLSATIRGTRFGGSRDAEDEPACPRRVDALAP